MSHHAPDVTTQISILSDDDKAINHYEKLRDDIRGEIKLRINQRDNFSIQLITMLGLLCSVGFANQGYNKVILIAPLITIYYTMQILYSYRLHDLLARYLREVLEPTLAGVCKTDPSHEWERYYAKHAMPGIRRAFFLWAMWVVCLGALTYLYFATDAGFHPVLYIVSAVYAFALAFITKTFSGDIWKRKGNNAGASQRTKASA